MNRCKVTGIRYVLEYLTADSAHFTQCVLENIVGKRSEVLFYLLYMASTNQDQVIPGCAITQRLVMRLSLVRMVHILSVECP